MHIYRNYPIYNSNSWKTTEITSTIVGKKRKPWHLHLSTSPEMIDSKINKIQMIPGDIYDKN